MKGTNGEYARLLAQKAANDWKAVVIGLEEDLSRDIVCFHIQQTAEKLLKALLVCRDVDFPLTHDLKGLLDLALRHFSELEEFRATLPSITDFAVRVRYTDPEPDLERAMAAYETVKRLRDVIHRLLPPEARP